MRFFLPLLLAASALQATDLKPWFGNEYETEIRATALYQNYNRLPVPFHAHYDRENNDVFLTLSAAYPFKKYCGEFEVTAADTHHQRGRWDNFRVTGRYQLLSELDNDPLSLVVGLTFCQPFSTALNDVSSFHHANIEGESHLSVGKKYGLDEYGGYIFRWWNVIGVGAGDRGSEWVRGDAACEYNYQDEHQLRLFVETLWGFGKDNLHLHHFDGYGSIRHKSVDVGMRYTLSLGCWGSIGFQYARRVYAVNFPGDVNRGLVEYYYPFGHQPAAGY